MHAAAAPDLDWDLTPLDVLEQQFAQLCPHCDELRDEPSASVDNRSPVADEAGWAIPGVTGLDRAEPEGLPPVSPVVAALVAAYDRVAASPSGQPDAQALADAEALLALQQRMHVDSVARVAEVGRRGLHELVGFRSVRTWLRARRPDGNAADAQLGQQLGDYPILQTAVSAGSVPLVSARRVVKALNRCWNHLDKAEGLIDGQPGDQVLRAVVGNTIAMICRYLNGLADDDPRLAGLIERGGQILEQAGSQRSQVEAALTLLAEHVPPRSLAPHIEELVLSLLPSVLDDKASEGHANRGLELKKKPDGSGWHLCGDLDLECGERLFVALRAEAHRDPDNINDTLAWAAQRDREQADCPLTGEPATPSDEVSAEGPLWFGLSEQLRPRSKPRRMHDALNRLLARYLEQGLGGTVNKLPVQIAVVITDPTLTGQPGAPPARADSGAKIPRDLVKRWWCDSSVTAFVLSLGGKALRAVHSQRTLTPIERKALNIETGGRCAGQGCCPDQPDPLQVLIPHHITMFSKSGRTSLDESLGFCDTSHQDIHEGKKTILLRDGRYLNEHGFTTPPPWPETEPPF